MAENIFTFITDNWTMIEAIVGILVTAIAVKFKIDKDEANEIADFALENGKRLVDFMNPKNETQATAPEGIPLETYAMQDKIKTLILNGKSQDDMQSILAQITAAEAQGLAAYQIKWSGGVYDIEYGYLADPTQITPPGYLDEPRIMTGTFDPKQHTESESGWTPDGKYVRGLKMPDSRFNNMVHSHSEAERVDMRKQVDEAEAAGLRDYKIAFNGGYYLIHDGIQSGGVGIPKEAI